MRHLATAAVVLVLIAAACGDDGATPTTSPDQTTAAPAPTSATTAAAPTDPGGVVVAVAAGAPGDHLVDGDGRTLYLFTVDTPGEASACVADCEVTWPPLVGEATAGAGADADLLGSTVRQDGASQVTYNGWPLYYFAADAAPGDTNGQGVGDVWFVVSPAGDAVN